MLSKGKTGGSLSSPRYLPNSACLLSPWPLGCLLRIDAHRAFIVDGLPTFPPFLYLFFLLRERGLSSLKIHDYVLAFKSGVTFPWGKWIRVKNAQAGLAAVPISVRKRASIRALAVRKWWGGTLGDERRRAGPKRAFYIAYHSSSPLACLNSHGHSSNTRDQRLTCRSLMFANN